MKKLLIVLSLLIIISLPLFATESIDFNYTDLFQINRSSSDGLDITVSFDGINTSKIKSEQGEFTDLSIDGYTHTNRIGAPRLPMLRKIFSVPLGAEVKAYTDDYDLQDFKAADYGISRIYPAQESVEKLRDAVVEFSWDEAAYNKQGFTANPVVSVEELGMMRGERLFVINFYPVQYDPVQQIIRVYNNVNIKVEFTGGDIFATQQLRAKTYSPAFEHSIAKSVFNYTPVETRDTLTRRPMGYLIISDRMFEAQLEPFITWKTEEGYNVTVAYTDDIGTTTSAIQNYIQGIWDSATEENPAPTYLLFCGDDAQIPAYQGSTNSGHITDLNYVRLEGSDYIPEMYYGRFSARNTAEFQPQIDKTLEYEKYEMPDPSYLGEAVMIAGVDSNYAPTYGNGQITYGTDYYFNEAHGIESHTYLYPASESSSSSIIQNLSDGVGYANYTAHGYYQEWSNPSVDNSDLASLSNAHKYPVVVGNCCLTNHFDTATCFGEQWLRVENKGAVGYIGGTNSTYWDEDFWWGVGSGNIVVGATYETHGRGVYDGLFRDGANEAGNFSSWYTTTGQMIFNGNLAVTEGGSSRINYYWEIYSLMGDPSLNVYLGVPDQNNVTLPSTFLLGVNSATITADPFSCVAISVDGVLHGTALVDAGGSVDMDFTPFTEPGTARVVVTAPNTIPVIAGIDIIPNDNPYVTLAGFELSDGNDNLPSFDETIIMSITLENIGSVGTSSVNATLSTSDSYVTITDGFAAMGDIPAGSTSSSINSFEFTLADHVPDQHVVQFTLIATSSEDSWESEFNVTVNAPLLEPGSLLINDITGDDNGILDPGETAVISIPISNNGHSASLEGTAVLSCGNPDLLTVNTASVLLPSISASGSSTAMFEVSVAAGAAVGNSAALQLNLTSGAYTAEKSYQETIGLVFENFETGDFSKFDWINGNPGWQISDTAQEGSYAAQSSDIDNNQNASLSITLEAGSDGEISFYKKVSSENNYDYLRFFINGDEQGAWSGTVDWSLETFSVPAGSVELEWRYTKDYSVSSGSDCAWIDYIDFTQLGSVPSFGMIAGNVSLTGGSGNIEDVLISADSFTSQPDSNGDYTMQLPPGTYDLEISLTGYNSFNQQDVVVTAGTETAINAELEAFSPPADIELSTSGDQLTIGWETMAGASSYKVYASDDPVVSDDDELIAHISGTSLSLDFASRSKFYYIKASSETAPSRQMRKKSRVEK